MSEFDNYKRQLEAQLEEWDAEVRLMEARLKKEAASEKGEQGKEIEKLRTAIETSKETLNELKGTGDEAWKTMKEGLDKAWNELNTSFKEAKSKF